MKAQELMIGDLVKFPGWTVDKVVDMPYVEGKGLCASFAASTTLFPFSIVDIEPIPLTPEILEKNGFTYCKSDGGFYLPTTISYGNWDVDVILFNVTDEYRNNQLHIGTPDDSITFLHLMECNHVHELQHALRLCGIEKEIVLQ